MWGVVLFFTVLAIVAMIAVTMHVKLVIRGQHGRYEVRSSSAR